MEPPLTKESPAEDSDALTTQVSASFRISCSKFGSSKKNNNDCSCSSADKKALAGELESAYETYRGLGFRKPRLTGLAPRTWSLSLSGYHAQLRPHWDAGATDSILNMPPYA